MQPHLHGSKHDWDEAKDQDLERFLEAARHHAVADPEPVLRDL